MKPTVKVKIVAGEREGSMEPSHCLASMWARYFLPNISPTFINGLTWIIFYSFFLFIKDCKLPSIWNIFLERKIKKNSSSSVGNQFLSGSVVMYFTWSAIFKFGSGPGFWLAQNIVIFKQADFIILKNRFFLNKPNTRSKLKSWSLWMSGRDCQL